MGERGPNVSFTIFLLIVCASRPPPRRLDASRLWGFEAMWLWGVLSLSFGLFVCCCLDSLFWMFFWCSDVLKSKTTKLSMKTKQSAQSNQPTNPTNLTKQPRTTTNKPILPTNLNQENDWKFITVFLKMKPWGTPNGSQRHPKGVLKSRKNRSGAQNDPKLVPGGSIANVDHPLGVIFGTPEWFLGPPEDPRIDQKIDFRRKLASQGSDFLDFC